MAMKSFKEYTKSLKEGFLDDDNKEQLAADNFSTVEEKDKPFPEENLDDDLTTTSPETGDAEVDLSDELGTADAEADKTEKEDLADLKLDELGDDNVKDSGDQKQEEKEAEREVAERTADNMEELKDAIATLTTKLEAISDKIDNAGNAAEGEAAGGEDDLSGLENLDLPAEGGDAAAPAEGGDTTGEAAPAEGTPEGEAAPAEGQPAEEEQNAGSDEDFGEDEVDNTKSEAYNFYAKKGGILNSHSGSLIGKAVNDKLYELQEDFMNIAKAKIRQLVEAEKKRLKESHFNF